MEFPYHNLGRITADRFYCKSILGSFLESEVLIKKGVVRGRIFQGTERVAVQIRENKLSLITQPMFNTGNIIDDSPFSLIKNSDNQIVAIDIDSGPSDQKIINIFTLNRNSGLAVWSKLRSDGFLLMGNNPDIQSHYMLCGNGSL